MISQYIRSRVEQSTEYHDPYLYKIMVMLAVVWKGKGVIFKMLLGKYVYLRQVELVLTTKCSLQCRDCANLIQYYEKPYDVPKENIKKEIHKLVQYFDEIDKVVLLGGEPFVYADISEIIDYIATIEKVREIHIFTNGTIVPKEACIPSLQNEKVKIIISDYGKISRRKEELKAFCIEHKINFHLKDEDLVWGYVGDMNPRNRSVKQLQQQFVKCKNQCRSILNGKLYYCPRAAHGHDLGYVQTNSCEYVDLLDGKISKKKLLDVLYSRHFFSACDYCNYGTKEMIPIEPGVQLKKNEKESIFEK